MTFGTFDWGLSCFLPLPVAPSRIRAATYSTKKLVIGSIAICPNTCVEGWVELPEDSAVYSYQRVIL